MKRFRVVVLGTAILLATGATMAQDLKVPAPAGKAVAQPARRVDAKAQMERMDAQMKTMRGLHDRMLRAATPDERQKLMEEQHRAIQQGIDMINRMMGGMNGGAPLEQKAGAPDPNGSMQLMQKGIEMMALMTQMMMDQLGLRTPPTGPASAPGK